MTLTTKSIQQFSRIVIKIGSSLLVDSEAGLKRSWLNSLLFDVAELADSGCDVLIVSSGAIALGRQELAQRGSIATDATLKLEESQAAAAIGQIALSQVYSELLKQHGLVAAQILLTIDETEQRHRYLNARNTIATVLKWKAIPIINENDSVATSEIRYGDNDRLAARVASMSGADLLILLSDIDGLYDSPPQDNPNAKLISHVPEINSEIEAMAGDAASILSRGGMKTKVQAAKIATVAGATMIIASGKHQHPIARLEETRIGTWFDPAPEAINERKKWIAGGLEIAGSITIDAGALAALERGKSLLPAGVSKVEGSFSRGEAVAVFGPNGHTIARGLIEYDSQQAAAIIGLKSHEVAEKLGTATRSAMIHRDNLVVE